MPINQIAFIAAIFLIIINVLFVYDVPARIAYLLMSYTLVSQLETVLFLKIALGIILWLAFVIFHKTIWCKVTVKGYMKIALYKYYRKIKLRMSSMLIEVKENI